MMEYWNVDFKMMLLNYLILFQDEFFNNPRFHLPRTHYSSIPLFHYSNCSEANQLAIEEIKEVILWNH